ncbi:MAG TPA: stage V sporulation protein D, partial [Ruminococcaceae bacterium]|nr:stage V sporulation protein D [Oscillospiraceae bacterium]
MAKGTTIRMWHRTVFILLLIIILGFGTVVSSLAKLQLAQGAELKTKAFDNQLQSTPLTAQRGTIYDCNMKKLAESANVWDVILEPACITNDKDRKTISEGLSKILGLDNDDLLKKCQKKSSYYEVIKKKIEA